MTATIVIARHIEKTIAVCSFIAATALAFTSLLISEDHDIAAGVCLVIAQFLLLTASIFGLDYKLGSLGEAHPKRSCYREESETTTRSTSDETR